MPIEEPTMKDLTKNSEKYKARNEERRKKSVEEMELPEDATWDQIVEASKEKNRKEIAEKMGLPEDATWEKIDEARKGEGLRDND